MNQEFFFFFFPKPDSYISNKLIIANNLVIANKLVIAELVLQIEVIFPTTIKTSRSLFSFSPTNSFSYDNQCSLPFLPVSKVDEPHVTVSLSIGIFTKSGLGNRVVL